MALPQHDSSVGHSFGLEFDGVTIKDITGVSGLSMGQDVIELKQNTADGKFMIKKLPGRPQANEVTVTRGLSADNSFDQWIKNSRLGQMDNVRKNGAIIVYDYQGNVVKRYQLTNAWASSLTIPDMRAGEASVLEEQLTITFEEMQVQE